MSKSRRFEEDEGFMAWLKRNEYEAISKGVKIYMWEAWKASRLYHAGRRHD